MNSPRFQMRKRVFDLASLGAACLGILAVGCGDLDGADPAVQGNSDPIIAGNNPAPTDRPYENLFVKVTNTTNGTYCSGTLIGGPTTARYVLTARHCFSATSDAVYISGPVKLNGTAIYYAPHAANGDTVDAALVKLEKDVTVPGAVYFTNMDGQELVGTQVRCYGYGNTAWDPVQKKFTGGGNLHYGDFTVADHSGSTTLYDLDVPNSAGQATAPGDSGGSCFHSTSFHISAITVTGICKAGSSSGVPTYNDQTSATAFSSWVRTFVPRP
jgi:hypothetical protein